MDDDDDWTGEPPEGRYTRDRAQPGFWRGQRPPGLLLGGLVLVVVIAIVLILLLG
jgi:hypothetical protein